jgi:rhodanese-related sulfurtransferase/predicted methyltransferase
MKQHRALLIAAAVGGLIVFSSYFAGAGETVDGPTAARLVSEGARLVDVRTTGEFAAGHIEGAVNIPVQELADRLDELEPRDAPVVLYCRSGRRSASAQALLRDAGFESVYDLGAIGNWRGPAQAPARRAPEPEPEPEARPAAQAEVLAQGEHGEHGEGSAHGSEHGGHGEHGEHGGHGPGHGMTHDFSDAERWSEVFDAPERDAWQMPGHVIEVMGVAEGMVVADIGAGTGYFEAHLAPAVGQTGRVLALDVEQTLVDFMNRRAAEEGWTNVEARLVPFDDPQLAPGSVDRILIVDTWHHIGEREAYAAKLLAGLREGGVLYVVDFTLETDRGPHRDHRLSEEQVIAELAVAGFAAEVVAESLPDQYIVAGRRP